jgi:uncharacterized protein YdeI (BOF family)
MSHSFRLPRSLAAALALLTAAVAGCRAAPPQVLGVAPQSTVRSVAEVRAVAPGEVVTVRGELVEKCPVAGCWFDVRDPSGTLRVDTKSAGFVVLDVPLRSPVTVGGRVAQNGSERVLDATGLRY